MVAHVYAINEVTNNHSDVIIYVTHAHNVIAARQRALAKTKTC